MESICCIRWDLVWAALAAAGAIGAAVATIFLVVVGLRQLRDIRVTGGETFLQNLKKDFFTQEARYILALLENDLLKFKTEVTDQANNPQGEFGYFELVASPNQQLDKLLSDLQYKDGGLISSYEMDDFLLQHLEDIGFLYKKHLIDIVNVDQLFGYYIESVFESEAIKKYTAWVRKDDNDIYSNFEGVYTALETYLSQTSK